MANLDKANNARKEMALNKLWRFNDHGVTSFKSLIDKGVFVESMVQNRPSIEWNRRKYNNMLGNEQADYEAKIEASKKNFYVLKTADESYHDVSPYVFEYFDTWKEAQDIKENPDKYCTDQELDHLFGGVNVKTS